MGIERLMASNQELRFERQRRGLIEVVREHGIDDLEVLRAFDLTPRHLFLPESVQHRAYDDAPVPIGFGQTASQPSLLDDGRRGGDRGPGKRRYRDRL